MSSACKQVKLDLEIYKKVSKTWEVRFKKNGIRTPITGWTVYFTVKEKLSDDDSQAVIQKDITPDDPSNGIALIELSSTDTDVTKNNYYYDIKYKDSEGKTGILMFGRITFLTPVTQRT